MGQRCECSTLALNPLQVTYSVSGDGGYVADVSYTGEAQYPPEPAGGYPGRK